MHEALVHWDRQLTLLKGFVGDMLHQLDNPPQTACGLFNLLNDRDQFKVLHVFMNVWILFTNGLIVFSNRVVSRAHAILLFSPQNMVLENISPE